MPSSSTTRSWSGCTRCAHSRPPVRSRAVGHAGRAAGASSRRGRSAPVGLSAGGSRGLHRDRDRRTELTGHRCGAHGLGVAIDCRIQHLLVDEFQDTSQSQYELLTRLVRDWQLGDGRTLFLVGDPMQSIYGFREAGRGSLSAGPDRRRRAGRADPAHAFGELPFH